MKIKYTPVILLLSFNFAASAQIFTTITDTSNPIVTGIPQSNYNGASWVDYDNDNRLDLFIVRTGLYHNEGNGEFTDVTITSGLTIAGGIGNTWADYNNDGYLDCFISGGGTFGSKLFLNNTNGTFSQNNSGPFSAPTSLRGWGSAWGDYDNDGLTDIVIAAPFGFASITDSNKLLHNDGNGIFSLIDTTLITCCEAPYTVPVWSDFDQDGDQDIFIGSGPVNGTVAKDFMYENQLTESGQASFADSIPSPMSNDLRDGQQWSWIDFDNDRDLDGYVTNYTGLNGSDGYPNDFYRNDNGTYVQLTATDVGDIVGDADISLANVWEDFDNDGDLDCIVINDGGQNNDYFQSNIIQGNTVFTKVTTEPFISSTGNPSYSATAGDYDLDGDLDLFVTAASTARGLYRNDVSNGNKWVNIHLTGLISNKAAIGAQIHAKATINGIVIWQMREVSAQNSFDGMNSLNIEFGFGNAIIIDSLIIKWPSGLIDKCSNIPLNQFYEAAEGNCLNPVGIPSDPVPSKGILNIYPNPAMDQCTISFIAPANGDYSILVSDLLGNYLDKLFDGHLTEGLHEVSYHSGQQSAGIYFVYINSPVGTYREKIILNR